MTAIVHGTNGFDGPAYKLNGIGVRLIAQIQSTTLNTLASGTTLIPIDDTIPQITEGDEYMSLSFTPLNAASTLEIEVEISAGNSATGSWIGVALFQDAIANAIAAKTIFSNTAGGNQLIKFTHRVSAASLTARTYRVRAGGHLAGTTSINGTTGVRYYGGVMSSSITVREILP